MASNSGSIRERHEKEQEKREIRHHLISFGMMVALTIFAFIAVASKGVSDKFVPLFILLLAVIQVIFQVYYFMHLKEKGHSFPALLLASGVLVAVLTVASLMTLIWYF